MADKVQRYGHSEFYRGEGLDLREDGPYVRHEDYAKIEAELDNYRLTFRAIERQSKVIAALHASIIEQGRLVQIGVSGESKYGAMSDSDFIEWMLGKLEGR
ncbi:hypothetical protein P8936_16410 [Edaphobacter paludis]|uniref:Uncharacterized protein n=1 Tax=Edaphobacter paludis TaxID=3035702 RepID=A0AAU7D610_9BACT